MTSKQQKAIEHNISLCRKLNIFGASRKLVLILTTQRSKIPLYISLGTTSGRLHLLKTALMMKLDLHGGGIGTLIEQLQGKGFHIYPALKNEKEKKPQEETYM